MFWPRKRGEEKGKQKKKRAVTDVQGSKVWWYMNRQLGVKPEVLLGLKWVEQDGVVGGKQVIMIRIFDPATAKEKGVAIDDYESLDNHPDLILYQGYYLEIGGEAKDIHIEKK